LDNRTWVEARRPALARSARQFADETQIREALAALDPSALRTLLGAASSASCLDEVLILLRYQQGRDRAKWRDVLVAGIEKQLLAAAKVHAGTDEPDQPDQAEALLATTWLGFLVQIHRFYFEAGREVRGGEAKGRDAGRK